MIYFLIKSGRYISDTLTIKHRRTNMFDLSITKEDTNITLILSISGISFSLYLKKTISVTLAEKLLFRIYPVYAK